MSDFLILGAGVAGLAAAGALERAGGTVTVLDKGRGPGGRVATRRVDGQPVDHGIAYLHGSHPDFVAALRAVPATVIEGWPRAVSGRGQPCDPSAFETRRAVTRLAFAEGVAALPRHLASGLDLRSGVRAVQITQRETRFDVVDEGGQIWSAPSLVLALPVEQAAALLAPDFATARALLAQVGTVPCHTVIACYEGSDEPLDIEMLLPESSKILQLISHDSSKRPLPRARVLVLQARPAWSTAHLEAPSDEVVAAMLAEAALLLGPWAGAPAHSQHHRWRYARVRGGDRLGAPYLLSSPGGARLALIGEAFAPEGGVEGAFLSGQRLARMLFGETHE